MIGSSGDVKRPDMKFTRENCIRDQAVAATMLAMSLFVVEGLAMMTRFEEMPKDLAFRLMGVHMVLLVLFFAAGLLIHALLKLPVTLSSHPTSGSDDSAFRGG